MKYGQIIKPEDVPAMLRSGELEFGMYIEFDNDNEFTTPCRGTLEGFHRRRSYAFSSNKEPYSFQFARFPLPALKDGDPVLIRDWDSKNARWLGRIFKDFHFVSGIHVYADGRNRWTFGSITYSENWRLPTKKELHEAGLDGWYDGRIELEEG